MAARTFRSRDAATPVSRLALVLAFVFGVAFLTALLALVITFPNPTAQQFEVFRIIIALAAGGVGAVIPGLLDLRMSLGTKVALRAGGALAVFAVVYFYSPARWIAEAPGHTSGPIIQSTSGDCAPTTANVGGGVTISCTQTGRAP
ncbi:hypothetical protein VH569_34065 [Azospirillum sp. 11R-A]|uniref:hypothetical protein n=1 Tax=Azospirillum sp. 11R-A TaxID=3111634 RepID=UPI003C2A8D16